jgi:Lon protease-like protein
MTEDSLASGRMFGMVQPDASLPRTEHGSRTYATVAWAGISSFSETEDGRLLVTLSGVIRFRIVEEIAMRRGYRRVRADYAPFRPRPRAERPEAAARPRGAARRAAPLFPRARDRGELGRDRADGRLPCSS